MKLRDALIVLAAAGGLAAAAYVAYSRRETRETGSVTFRATLDGSEVSASGSIGGIPFESTPYTLVLYAGAYDVVVSYGGQEKRFPVLIEPLGDITVWAHFMSTVEPSIFSLTLSDTTPTVRQGQGVQIVAQVNHISGPNNVVILSASQPVGGSSTFSQAQGLPPFATTLTITAGASTPVGVHNVTVLGQGPDHQETVIVSVTVEAGGVTGRGSIYVEVFYPTEADPVTAQVTVTPGDIQAISPALIPDLAPGSYWVSATWGGYTSGKAAQVEADVTVNVRIVITGGPG